MIILVLFRCKHDDFFSILTENISNGIYDHYLDLMIYLSLCRCLSMQIYDYYIKVCDRDMIL